MWKNVASCRHWLVTVQPPSRIERPIRRKALTQSAPRIRCPRCGWSPGKHECGAIAANTHGTFLTREASALHASSSGPPRSVLPGSNGRHIPTGTRVDRIALALSVSICFRPTTTNFPLSSLSLEDDKRPSLTAEKLRAIIPANLRIRLLESHRRCLL